MAATGCEWVIDDRTRPCGQCGSEYRSLSQHWAKARDCDHSRATSTKLSGDCSSVMGLSAGASRRTSVSSQSAVPYRVAARRTRVALAWRLAVSKDRDDRVFVSKPCPIRPRRVSFVAVGTATVGVATHSEALSTTCWITTRVDVVVGANQRNRLAQIFLFLISLLYEDDIPPRDELQLYC